LKAENPIKDVTFNWKKVPNPATITIPDWISNALGDPSKSYRDSGILELTASHLQVVLLLLFRDQNASAMESQSPYNPGVLIHCISGWDRTPLFISLVRLSLWADGEIHQ